MGAGAGDRGQTGALPEPVLHLINGDEGALATIVSALPSSSRIRPAPSAPGMAAAAEAATCWRMAVSGCWRMSKAPGLLMLAPTS